MTPPRDSDRSRLPGLLLVDPDPRVRDALARAMENEGWRVWSAADGTSAVEIYHQNRDQIDVALVDLLFPGLQGGRLLAELGQLDPDLVRCAMSGGVNAYTASAFRRMSGTPLFTKPLDTHALACALHEMMAPAAPQ